MLSYGSSRGVGEGYPLRGYTRLVGAPNYAPSLRSVAGLLLALGLGSRYEDTLASLGRDSLQRPRLVDRGGGAKRPARSAAVPARSDSTLRGGLAERSSAR